jgi:hypothetical protein
MADTTMFGGRRGGKSMADSTSLMKEFASWMETMGGKTYSEYQESIEPKAMSLSDVIAQEVSTIRGR